MGGLLVAYIIVMVGRLALVDRRSQWKSVKRLVGNRVFDGISFIRSDSPVRGVRDTDC